MQLQPLENQPSQAVVSGTGVAGANVETGEIYPNWKVGKAVLRRIQQRKQENKAKDSTTYRLNQYNLLNADLTRKIGLMQKDLKNDKSKSSTSKQDLRKVEKSLKQKSDNLEVQRWSMIRHCGQGYKKRRLDSKDKKEVQKDIVHEFSRPAHKKNTTFKLLLNDFKNEYQGYYDEIKLAIDRPDLLVRLQDFSRFELRERLKVYSNILTAFDVLLNLSVGYRVSRPNFYNTHDFIFDCGELHKRSYLVDSATRCRELRKKQREYYNIIKSKKEKIFDPALTQSFRDVTKYQQLVKGGNQHD